MAKTFFHGYGRVCSYFVPWCLHPAGVFIDLWLANHLLALGKKQA
jgi:hypothetical protein